jgi:hypothetical protein
VSLPWSQRLGPAGIAGLVTVAYVIAARFGPSLAFVDAPATFVWPP